MKIQMRNIQKIVEERNCIWFLFVRDTLVASVKVEKLHCIETPSTSTSPKLSHNPQPSQQGGATSRKSETGECTRVASLIRSHSCKSSDSQAIQCDTLALSPSSKVSPPPLMHHGSLPWGRALSFAPGPLLDNSSCRFGF